MDSAEEVRDLLARLHLLALDLSVVVGQLALHGGRELVAGHHRKMTIDSAARLVGLSQQTLRRAVDRGDVPSESVIGCGVTYRIVSEQSVLDWAKTRPRRKGARRVAR